MTKRKANPQKAGRKRTYKTENDLQAYKYALLGLIDVEMAKLFGVSEFTFNGWKKRYPTFSTSINNGKEIADADVTHSLVERAKGFTVTEQVPTKVKEVTYKDGKRLREIETVIVTTVEKQVPPDTRAIQYWLNNRRRRKPVAAAGDTPLPADNSWADRHEVDHTTGGDKLPAPQVYLPTDLPEDIMGDVPPDVDPLTGASQ